MESAVMGDKWTLYEWFKYSDESEELLKKMGLRRSRDLKKKLYDFFQKRLDIIARGREGYTFGYCDVPYRYRHMNGDKTIFSFVYNRINRNLFSLPRAIKNMEENNEDLHNQLNEMENSENNSEIRKTKKLIEKNEKIIQEYNEILEKSIFYEKECQKNDNYVYYLLATTMIKLLEKEVEKKQKTDDNYENAIKKLEREKKEFEQKKWNYEFVDEEKLCKKREYKNTNLVRVEKKSKEIEEWKKVSEEVRNNPGQPMQFFEEKCKKILKDFYSTPSEKITGEIELRRIDKEFLTKIVEMFSSEEDFNNLKQEKWEKFCIEDRMELCDIISRLTNEGCPWKINSIGVWEEDGFSTQNWINDLYIKMMYPGYYNIKMIILDLIENDQDVNDMKKTLEEMDGYITKFDNHASEKKEDEHLDIILQDFNQDIELIVQFKELLMKLHQGRWWIDKINKEDFQFGLDLNKLIKSKNE